MSEHNLGEVAILRNRVRQLESMISNAQLGAGFQLSSSPSSYQASTSQRDGRRHSTTPRSAQVGLAVQAGHLNSAPDSDYDAPMLKRARTAHAPQPQHARRASSANMARSSSSMSAKSNPAIPFQGRGPVPPLLMPPASSPRPQSSTDYSFAVASWSQDTLHQPANEAMLSHSIVPSCHPQDMPMLAEESLQNVGMDPSQFLLSRGQEVSVSPLASSPMGMRKHLSPTDAYHYNPGSTLTPTSGSLTDAPTLETPMSRQNSNVYDSILSGGISMFRIDSQSSNDAAVMGLSRQNSTKARQSSLGKRPCGGEEDLLGVGVSLGSSMPPAYPPSTLSSSLSSHKAVAMERIDSVSSIGSSGSGAGLGLGQASGASLEDHLSMERSISNTSIKSTQSLKLRAKDALRRQNSNAMKAPSLYPKPLEPLRAKPQSSSQATAGAARAKDGKKEITKSKYERPKHPKVKCQQCNDYPDGFRGEHELRRHVEAKHKGVVRKWVCRDPGTVGITSPVPALNPLEKCKACNSGKAYGAYYNAAAHLRRTHFKKKPRKGPNKAATQDADDKRGGKGGGDWPPMAVLKLWMYEVQVSTSDPGAFSGLIDTEDLDYEMGANPGAADAQLYEMDTRFAGMTGCNFGPDPSEGGDFSNEAFQSVLPLDSMDQDAYIPAAGAAATPMSSAGFFESAVNHSLLSGPIGDYATSPVSSSAPTITQTTYPQDPQRYFDGSSGMAGQSMPGGEEFDFDMVFTGAIATSAY